MLPVLDSNLCGADCADIIKIGFCRVQISPEIEKLLPIISDAGIDFFRKSIDDKMKWARNEQTTYSEFGYANRQSEDNPQQVQVFHLDPDNVFSVLNSVSDIIKFVAEYFENMIAKPLMKKVLDYLKITGDIESTFNNFTLVYYDGKKIEGTVNGIIPHRDFGLITVLAITKPGLEVMAPDGLYHKIDPVPGSVIVNFGNAFELITGGQCASALHKVEPLNYERISLTMFVDYKLDIPIQNLKTGEILYANSGDYLAEQTKHYRSGNMSAVQKIK